jgi:hypothetical protein
MSNTRLHLTIASVALCAALGQPAAAGPVPAGTGKTMCSALNTSDFTSVGIQGTTGPQANVIHPTAAYCVYAGNSGASGGVEFDVFYPAGATPAAVKAHEHTLMMETGGSVGEGAYSTISMPGVDAAHLGTDMHTGKAPFDSIVVRKGNLILIITIPATAQAPSQLRKLATIALRRFATVVSFERQFTQRNFA